MRSLALILPVLALAPTAPRTQRPASPAPDRCEVRREVERTLDAAGLRGVLADVGSGSLEVVGRTGDVRVRGTICASSAELADDARLVVERRRDAAWIETDLPEAGGWRDEYVRMDLVVEMPAGLPADITDGSGSIDIRSIAAVHIEDGSGSIAVEDVPGAVEIQDRSGGIRVRGVGSVTVDDGSGEIHLSDVRGDVRIIDDGSGGIDIRDVTGDVRIDDDGSGSIEVARVGGDFVVGDAGSGSVRYRDVRGRVDIPR